jgi:hypothetical protein
MSINDKVRKEKDEYEDKIDEDLQKTEEDLNDAETYLPAKDTGSTLINKLLGEYYDEEVLEHMKLTKAQVKILKKELRAVPKTMMRKSGAKICLGPKCAQGASCPLQKAKCSPVGHSCVLEMMIMDKIEEDYVEDLKIDTQSKVEMDLVREMVEADIIDWRTSFELSNRGLFDWHVVAVTEKGSVIKNKIESVAFGIKMKLKNRKDKLREDLLATRKMKAKFGLDKRIDPSKFASDLNQRYENIKSAEDASVEEAK